MTKKVTTPTEDVAKRLTIVLDTLHPKADPKYYFKGNWSGKDVLVVMRAIKREYYKYTRDLRRAHAQEVATQPTTSLEPSMEVTK